MKRDRELSMLVIQQYALPPSEPGGTRHYELAQVFSEMAWKVRIFASDFSHLEKRFFRRKSNRSLRRLKTIEGDVAFTYAWVPVYERNNWRRSASMAWFALRAFLEVLWSSERVVYASSPHIFGCFTSFLGAKIRRRRFVFEVRDLWPEHLAAVNPQMEGGRLYRLIGAIANLLYAKADLVVLFAEGSREIVQSRGAKPERIHLITGVDLPDPPVSRPHHDVFRFVYLGSIGPMYALMDVIAACEILTERGVDRYSLTFIGDGPDRAALESRVRQVGLGCVSFEAPIPKQEIYSKLQEFDAGILSFAHGEQFQYGISPQKMFDYMAVNLPIVSNVHGEVAEVIHRANAGVTSSLQSASSFADAMQSYIEAPSETRSRFHGGREFIANHANRRAMVEELADRIRLTQR